jgi:hypothetical protein
MPAIVIKICMHVRHYTRCSAGRVVAACGSDVLSSDAMLVGQAVHANTAQYIHKQQMTGPALCESQLTKTRPRCMYGSTQAVAALIMWSTCTLCYSLVSLLEQSIGSLACAMIRFQPQTCMLLYCNVPTPLPPEVPGVGQHTGK